MAITFSGFVHDDLGNIVEGATVDLYDRNTTTPSRANTTTNPSGYWTISHATEGKFDIKVANGTSVRWLMYDDVVQMERGEFNTLHIRDANATDGSTFKYIITPATLAAERILNLPVLTGTATLLTEETLERPVQLVVVDFGDDVVTGDGKYYFHVPSTLNGMNLIEVHAEVITAGTTNTTDIQVHNLTDTVDMLSTVITIDSGETGSDTAATPAVIDTDNDDVATNDMIRIDVDAVSTTEPKGLLVTLTFRLP